MNLNKELMEDKLIYKYQDEITEEERNIENSEKYKNIIKHLKKNNISDKEIENNYRYIIEYLKTNEDKKSLLKDIRLNKCESDLNQNAAWTETLYGEGLGFSGGTKSYDRVDLTEIIYLRCVIKMTEYTPISGGNISELNKIPDLFLNKRSLLILRNNDDKCFLYCYIREFLNPITKNRFRITKRDKALADKIINETNLNFENVSISEIDKIEKKLKVNVNVFSCNKKKQK